MNQQPRRSFLHQAIHWGRASLMSSVPLLTWVQRVEAASKAKDPRWALSEKEWKRRLSPEAFKVLRLEATEPPFTSPLNDEKRAGLFRCAGCRLPLFDANAKFDSGTGWPSFWQPLPGALATKLDFKLIVPRREYHCQRCGGHQGHVFQDGPKPTGLRYCNNGVALVFEPKGPGR